jgi:C4-type Zn-finger protein
MSETTEIPDDILEAAKSRFLFWCPGCRQAFQPNLGAYGLPYNGIQHIVCDSCLKKLNQRQEAHP